MEIRPLAPGDRPVLERLLSDIHEHYHGTPRPAGHSAAIARQLAEDGYCDVVLAWEGDDAQGLAVFSFLHPAAGPGGMLFLKELFVRAEARGRGIGRALMRHLAVTARRRGCSRIDWTTDAELAGALAFYRGIGAVEVPRKVYYRIPAAEFDGLIARLGGADGG
jgi:GNAT superfamily N-acetyltransferase